MSGPPRERPSTGPPPFGEPIPDKMSLDLGEKLREKGSDGFPVRIEVISGRGLPEIASIFVSFKKSMVDIGFLGLGMRAIIHVPIVSMTCIRNLIRNLISEGKELVGNLLSEGN
jgi:hypothetical protein